MSQLYMRFPGGFDRTLTLSYDDGVDQDIRLIEIMNKNGIKGTFNINSGLYAPEGKVWAEGSIHRRMSLSQVKELYTGSGHEVAVHALTHSWLEQLPVERVAYEIIKDRENLEAQFGCIVRGMAYPYGTLNDRAVEVIRNCGIVYARTTAKTYNFDMPKDWLRLPMTCAHADARLMELGEKFVSAKFANAPKMFYVFGHAYEFDRDNNWEVIERFCEFMGGRDNIWYATNIEIYEYTKAFESLVYSVDGSIVHNPTATKVWYCDKASGVCGTIDAGETKRFS